MPTFIAEQIIKARKLGLDQGLAKYGAYFVKTKIYENYRAAVETIIRTEGYDDVITLPAPQV